MSEDKYAELHRRKQAIRNEQAKLTATYINGLAIAVFAVGGLSPFMVGLNPSGGDGHLLARLGLLVVCSLGSGVLHSVARDMLGKMEP